MYEQLEAELADFQTSSKELAARDIASARSSGLKRSLTKIVGPRIIKTTTKAIEEAKNNKHTETII